MAAVAGSVTSGSDTRCVVTIENVTPCDNSVASGILEKVTMTASGKTTSLKEIISANSGLHVSTGSFVLPTGVVGYVVIVHSKNDNILIALAKKYGFPRGFPIIWIPRTDTEVGLLQSFGFYPKFDNDDRNKEVDSKIFDNAVAISGSLKYSGFLGGVLPFQYGDTTYVVYASKNAAFTTSPFVQNVRRIFEMSPDVNQALTTLAAEGKGLYGEFLSFDDQKHGYAISNEVGVVTAICKSNIYPLDDADTISPEAFVKFASADEIDGFCKQYGISRDGHFTATGSANIVTLMQALEKARDHMTLPVLLEILSSNASWISGNIQHATCIASDIVEGLVMKLSLSDGTTTTVKYKFPAYTIRTMLYRQCMEKEFVSTGAIDKFLSIWCMTSQGRDYWGVMARAFFVAIRQKTFAAPEHNIIADHIWIADRLAILGPDTIQQLAAQYDTIYTMQCADMIVVIGPIGHGKSTFAAALYAVLADSGIKAVNIDGDDLGIGSDVTLKMGKERNPFTQSQVLETIANGKVPIISTGGGALFDRKIGDLKTNAQRLLGVNLNVHLVIMSAIANSPIVQFVDGDIQSLVKAIYNNPDADALVTAAVQQRLDHGMWKLDLGQKPIDLKCKLTATSRKNAEFTVNIANIAKAIYIAKAVTPTSISSVAFPKQLFTLQSAPITTAVVVNQIRGLVSLKDATGKIVSVDHTTLSYYRSPTSVTIDTISGLKATLPKGPVDAVIATFTSICGVYKFVVAYPLYPLQIHTDGSTHFTIDAGIHFPAQMKNVLVAIRGRADTIALSSRNGPVVTYSLVPTNTVSVAATFHSVFYL